MYIDIRLQFIGSYYYKAPSMFKLTQLLNVQSIRKLTKLGKYLSTATKRRDYMPVGCRAYG